MIAIRGYAERCSVHIQPSFLATHFSPRGELSNGIARWHHSTSQTPPLAHPLLSRPGIERPPRTPLAPTPMLQAALALEPRRRVVQPDLPVRRERRRPPPPGDDRSDGQ